MSSPKKATSPDAGGPAPARSARADHAATAGAARPLRVLVVEDDEDDYLLTRDLLLEFGKRRLELEWVSTYQEALAVMSRQDHDVYLVDYRLDQHTGVDLLGHSELEGKPVIILTQFDDLDVDLRAMEAGAVDYLVKGRIDAHALERSIRYSLQRKQVEKALRHAQDELERRVQERTAELAQINETLRQKIEEHQRADQALRLSTEALQEADRRKDEFLAMLGHELRNPLAAIRNGLHILWTTQGNHELLGRVKAMMDTQICHLIRMVDDLLEVSRITRGKIQLHSESVELATVIQGAIESTRPLLEAHKHKLTIIMPPYPIRLRADPTRLEQVVVNLLNNAAKYTRQGGYITLTAEREGDQAVIRVRDNGIGIRSELLPKVFEPFVQAERSLDRSQGGLGIGLTLVQRLVELHGGTIEAHSEGVDQGSEFVVRLPAPSSNANGTEGLAPQSMPLSGKQRILIAEDNEEAAETLKLMLELWGYDVRAVHDGPAALIAYRMYQPDMVLLDIGLPGMNGYDLAKLLRLEPAQKRPFIMALTGYGREEDKRHAQEASFDYHIAKPADPEKLQKLLASLSYKEEARSL